MKTKELYFIYVCKEYSLCTTEIDASENTIDINFNEFAKDYELFNILHLISLAKSQRIKGQELFRHTAYYLAAFSGKCDDVKIKKEHDQKVAYMLNNGIIRILPTNFELKQKLTEWKNKKFNSTS